MLCLQYEVETFGLRQLTRITQEKRIISLHTVSVWLGSLPNLLQLYLTIPGVLLVLHVLEAQINVR
jgi:hypothetical protein